METKRRNTVCRGPNPTFNTADHSVNQAFDAPNDSLDQAFNTTVDQTHNAVDEANDPANNYATVVGIPQSGLWSQTTGQFKIPIDEEQPAQPVAKRGTQGWRGTKAVERTIHHQHLPRASE